VFRKNNFPIKKTLTINDKSFYPTLFYCDKFDIILSVTGEWGILTQRIKSSDFHQTLNTLDTLPDTFWGVNDAEIACFAL